MTINFHKNNVYKKHVHFPIHTVDYMAHDYYFNMTPQLEDGQSARHHSRGGAQSLDVCIQYEPLRGEGGFHGFLRGFLQSKWFQIHR